MPPSPRRAGNHDEPAGADDLSAVDILAACNLVNYYGKLVRRTGRVALLFRGADCLGWLCAPSLPLPSLLF